MTEVRGMDGVRGINVERPDGSMVKLDADKSGRIDVSDRRLKKKLIEEGFTIAGTAIAGFAKSYPCKCGHNSVFKICGKCGLDNG